MKPEKKSLSELDTELTAEIIKFNMADIIMSLRKRYRVERVSKLSYEEKIDFLEFLKTAGNVIQ